MAMVLIQIQSFLLLLCSHVVDNLKNQRFCFDNLQAIVHVQQAILCLMKILSLGSFKVPHQGYTTEHLYIYYLHM
jgi:hypothetical protein